MGKTRPNHIFSIKDECTISLTQSAVNKALSHLPFQHPNRYSMSSIRDLKVRKYSTLYTAYFGSDATSTVGRGGWINAIDEHADFNPKPSHPLDVPEESSQRGQQ